MNQYSDDFLRFWKVYPKRVGKLAAYRAWQYTLKKGLADAEQIIEAAYIFVKTEQGRGDRQYIPHPSTWLNQGRYDDEYEADEGLGKAERLVLDAVRTQSSSDVRDPLVELLSICDGEG